MGTFLGFKMSKSRGREEKLGQKKAERRKKKKLGNMRTPTNLWGFFLADFNYKTGEKLRFLTKMCLIRQEYTTSTERKYFGGLSGLEEKLSRQVVDRQPHKNQENHIYHRNLSSVAPIFFGKEKFLTGAGRCMLSFFQKFRKGVGGQRGWARRNPSKARDSGLFSVPSFLCPLRRMETHFWRT